MTPWPGAQGRGPKALAPTSQLANGVGIRQLEAALLRHTLRSQIERLPFLLGLPCADEKRVRSPHPFRRRKLADRYQLSIPTAIATRSPAPSYTRWFRQLKIAVARYRR